MYWSQERGKSDQVMGYHQVTPKWKCHIEKALYQQEGLFFYKAMWKENKVLNRPRSWMDSLGDTERTNLYRKDCLE